MNSYPDEGEEAVELMQAATIIILRHARSSGGNSGATGKGLEVLLGQNMVKNWLRSTPDKTVIMRYPGEWKFPGGVVERTDNSLEQTAIRELREEFIGVAPIHEVKDSDISLYMVNKKLTRPVKGKRYAMHNFVAIEDDNPWITANDIASTINENLQTRMSTFNSQIEDGSFWQLDSETKAFVSPELVAVQWMSLPMAISRMESSLNETGKLSCVNEWQRDEFKKYDIRRRDPMYQSMVTLMEIQQLGSLENFRAQDASIKSSSGGIKDWFDSFFK